MQSTYRKKDTWSRKPGLAPTAKIVFVRVTHACLQENERTLWDERDMIRTLCGKGAQRSGWEKVREQPGWYRNDALRRRSKAKASLMNLACM